MSAGTLGALLVYALVSSITPGPNNLMLLASGVNFGFRRTVPHMLGIGAGFVALLLATGWFLGALLVAAPELHGALKVIGAAYLLYLAWRIATARAPSADRPAGARPMRFLEAAAFQWVNPKAWVMAATAMALYVDPQAPALSVLLVAAVFGMVNLPSVSTWAGFGSALRGFLADPVRLKWFNVAMGAALAFSAAPLLAHQPG